MPRFEQQYMLEMVEARRTSSETEQQYDLFSGLLDASHNESDDGLGAALSDDELIGK
jgi:hypothetical protein